jgi:hypothetical protein
MDATALLLLLQVPPPASVSTVVEPTQRFDGPDIADGSGFTVSTLVTRQPVDNVYEMVVVPADTPERKPVNKLMVATEVELLIHVPPPASVKEVFPPTQTAGEPDIGAGKGFTITTVVVIHPVDVSV